MKRIIITGCGGPAGINFVNSLRFSGEKMYLIGIDVNKYHLEWPDVDERYLVPKFTDPSYINKLNELARRTNAELVHPQPDGEVRILSEHRERIKPKLFLPVKETIRICQDKLECARIWHDKGIPVAKALPVRNEADLTMAEDEFGYPYWLRARVGFSSRGSALVRNIETAKHWIGYWAAREDVDWEFIAQEYLPGKIMSFQSIWKDGGIVTSQARERLEYLYPYLSASGVTNTPTVAVTINRDDVNRIATECVLAVDPHATGIFCVDLRENKDGVPCPTEINAGRFFTTSFFFTRAGVNMPYYYVKLAYGEELPRLPRYNALPEGLYWIRHIDAPAILRRNGEWKSVLL